MGLEEITKDTVKGAAIRELQGLAMALVAGAAKDTNIAITGVTVRRTTIVGVLEFVAATPVLNDRTAEANVTSDGNIQLDTTDTSGSQLVVLYFHKAE